MEAEMVFVECPDRPAPRGTGLLFSSKCRTSLSSHSSVQRGGEGEMRCLGGCIIVVMLLVPIIVRGGGK